IATNSSCSDAASVRGAALTTGGIGFVSSWSSPSWARECVQAIASESAARAKIGRMLGTGISRNPSRSETDGSGRATRLIHARSRALLTWRILEALEALRDRYLLASMSQAVRARAPLSERANGEWAPAE